MPDRAAAFHNALLTEHFVLQSARGVTVSESSSRASLYIMTLSSTLVAFGFLAGTHLAFSFLGIVLPIVVLLGLFTYERLVDSSLEDIVALEDIQRIRSHYATLLPGADKFFPLPNRGAAPNELLDIGGPASWRGGCFTMSSTIAVVNSMVAGAGIAVLVFAVAGSEPAGIILGVSMALAFAAAHCLYQEKRYRYVNACLAHRRKHHAGG